MLTADGQDNSFYFRAGGDFICTRNGSFDNVEIRSTVEPNRISKLLKMLWKK
ncbi:L-shaped tail fiber protein [Klebsiella phage CPRSA]|nr:L-shaped tail fiber protein [Klebsiella phage CPRSA]